MLWTVSSSRGDCYLSSCLYQSCYSENSGAFSGLPNEDVAWNPYSETTTSTVEIKYPTQWLHPVSATVILSSKSKLTCKPLTSNVALAARRAVRAHPHITVSILSLLPVFPEQCLRWEPLSHFSCYRSAYSFCYQYSQYALSLCIISYDKAKRRKALTVKY